MVAVDWTRGDLSHGLRVLFIDPLNLQTVRGFVDGAVSGTLDWDYYSETRGGAKVELVGNPWDGTSAMRLVHTVSDYSGKLLEETLFTGYVTGFEPSESTTTYTLSSALYGLKTNLSGVVVSFGTGSHARDMIEHMMRSVSRPFRFGANFRDVVYSGPFIRGLEVSNLEIISNMCDDSNNRMTVDADGIVVIDAYSAPSQRTPDWSEDSRALRTTIVGEPRVSDDGLTRPERVIVHAEQGGQSVVAHAIAPDGTATRHSVRGYCIDSYHKESNLIPFNWWTAQQLAEQYLASELAPDMRCSHRMMYRPLREGMVERLTYNGETRRWHIASASLDLVTFIWNLEMKGGWSD